MSLEELFCSTVANPAADSNAFTHSKDIFAMNTVSSSHIVSDFRKIFIKLNIYKLAKHCGFQQRRKRKSSVLDYMLCFCLAAQSGVQASFSSCAFVLSGLCRKPISKQILHKRCGPKLLVLMKRCLAALLKQKLPSSSNGSQRSFGRVLVQDSTSFKVHSRFARRFPASGNQQHKRLAQAKIQAILDIKNATFLHFGLSGFLRNDQAAAADILKVLRAGDLVLRDLGYFGVAACHDILKRNAFFISRYRYRTALFNADGSGLDLVALLKKKQHLDTMVLLGKEKKLALRLVAIPVNKKVASARRRKLRQHRDKRLKPSKAQLKLQDWTILITNVSADTLSSEKIAELYALRWRIEMVFKAWKSHFGIHLIPTRCSANQVEALIYARLMLIVLFHSALWLPLAKKQSDVKEQPLSYLKCSRIFTHHFWLINVLFEQSPLRTRKLLRFHCKYEKRSTKKNFAEKAEVFDLLAA